MPNVLAYADDLVLLSDSEQNLQRLLDMVAEWCNKWRVLINVMKSKVVNFRRRNTPRTTCQFKISNEVLETVEKYKYLGIVLTELLDYNVTIDHLVNSASRALGSVIGKTKSNQYLGYASYTKLFDSLVCPILDYGSGVWNTGLNCKKLDQIQNRAIRYYLGVPRTSPIAGIEGMMGWTPGIVRRDLESLCFYNQVIKLPDTRLPKILYDMDKAHNGLWSNNIENIAKCAGAHDEWLRNEQISIKKI